MSYIDMNECVEIMEECMLKNAELDKKLYNIIREKDIKKDIKEGNLDYLNDIVEDMYKLQCIINAVSLRYSKQRQSEGYPLPR